MGVSRISDPVAEKHTLFVRVSDVCNPARNFDSCVVSAYILISCGVPTSRLVSALVQSYLFAIHFVTYFGMVSAALIYRYSSFQDFWFSPYSLSIGSSGKIRSKIST